MNNLETALSFGGILPARDVDYILGFFELEMLKPGEDFLSIGDISKQIGFVDAGVLRVYVINERGEEATKYFIQKNQFLMDIESFYDNKPSTSAFEAVTNCRILSVKRNAWNNLSEKIPKLYILTKSLTEAALLSKIKDNEFLHFGSASDKYREFMQRCPDLALYVPLQHIASYLQITPQSLSRIRKNNL